jgi:hypothetical protein
MNFTQEDRSIHLPRVMKELLENKVEDMVTLPPYGVELLLSQN